MNFKHVGTALIIVGLTILLGGLIVGVIIGINSSTQTKIDNKDLSEVKDSDEGDYETADAANAFLVPFNMGVLSSGMGLLMIGSALFASRDYKGNLAVLIVAIAAILILLSAFILMTVAASISSDMTKIDNKNDPSKDDIDKHHSDEETISILNPIALILGGWSVGIGGFWFIGGFFNFNSLVFVLPFLTLLLGVTTAIAKKRGDEKSPDDTEKESPVEDEGTATTSSTDLSSSFQSNTDKGSGRTCPDCGGTTVNYPGYGYYCDRCQKYI